MTTTPITLTIPAPDQRRELWLCDVTRVSVAPGHCIVTDRPATVADLVAALEQSEELRREVLHHARDHFDCDPEFMDHCKWPAKAQAFRTRAEAAERERDALRSSIADLVRTLATAEITAPLSDRVRSRLVVDPDGIVRVVEQTQPEGPSLVSDPAKAPEWVGER